MIRVWSLVQRAISARDSTTALQRPDRRKCCAKRCTWPLFLHRPPSSRRGSGFVPVGQGIRPLLGAVPGAAGLMVGNGLGAAGLTIGPFAGRALAELALGHEP